MIVRESVRAEGQDSPQRARSVMLQSRDAGPSGLGHSHNPDGHAIGNGEEMMIGSVDE